MYEVVQVDGIQFVIWFVICNFNYQKGIWECKWIGQQKFFLGENVVQVFLDFKEWVLEILKYSFMLGIFRYYWGMDIDLNVFNNCYFEEG